MKEEFQLLNAIIRQPAITEQLQKTCRKMLKKDGIKKVESKMASTLKHCGFFDQTNEPFKNLAKVLN